MTRALRKKRLHPVLSNLLPEGVLREWFAQLVADLPGALIAEPVAPDQIPEGILDHRTHVKPAPRRVLDGRPHFSLAGVQMTFSMCRSCIFITSFVIATMSPGLRQCAARCPLSRIPRLN